MKQISDLLPDAKKFLTICEGGNCRSVALARVLKVHCGQQAVALGWRYATEELWSILGNWADYIVVMETGFTALVPEVLKAKVRILDVGPDTYGIPTHEDLYGQCLRACAGWECNQFVL